MSAKTPRYRKLFQPMTDYVRTNQIKMQQATWTEWWFAASDLDHSTWLKIRLLFWDNNLFRWMRNKWPHAATFFLGLACAILGFPGLLGVGVIAFPGVILAPAWVVILGIFIYISLAVLEFGNVFLKCIRWIRELIATTKPNVTQPHRTRWEKTWKTLRLFSVVPEVLGSICAMTGCALVSISMILSFRFSPHIPAIMTAVPILFIAAFSCGLLSVFLNLVDALKNDEILKILQHKKRHPEMYHLTVKQTAATKRRFRATLLAKLGPYISSAIISIGGVGIVVSSLLQVGVLTHIPGLLKDGILTMAGGLFCGLGIVDFFATLHASHYVTEQDHMIYRQAHHAQNI